MVTFAVQEVQDLALKDFFWRTLNLHARASELAQDPTIPSTAWVCRVSCQRDGFFVSGCRSLSVFEIGYIFLVIEDSIR